MFPGGFWPQGYWPASYWPKTGQRVAHGQAVGGKVGGKRHVIQEMMRTEIERSLLEDFARENLRKLNLRIEKNREFFRKERAFQKQVTDTAVWAAILSEV